MNFEKFLEDASHVKPSPQQLRMLRETPFYAFIHFCPNTYTNLEWGDGTESPEIFNPTELDCDQWAEAIKSAGMTGMVLTAKHHDGFCLWPSAYTEHSIKNSPYKDGKGDIVREASEACKRHGLKFGFYLSPWDRNSPLYGTDEYNDYYKNQLRELLTNYGDIFHVWFDGACGEGPNGKKQEYDMQGYFDLVHELQPDATIFQDGGNIRWCGNEAGRAPYAQWAVVPMELCPYNPVQTEGPLMEGSLDYTYNSDMGIGTIPHIMYSKGLVFAPAETDMSIRPGWFYHENEEAHSLERLFNTYITSVGNNATFNLNIPPMPNGKLNDNDVKRLKELGDLIRAEFSNDLSVDATISQIPTQSPTQPEFRIKLKEPKTIKYIELAEKISDGQRVELFDVSVRSSDGTWSIEKRDTTIGSKKIAPIDPSTTDEVRIRILSSRSIPEIEYIKLY